MAAPDGVDGPAVDPGWRACARWERVPDCLDCGACCREAFDAVPIDDADALTVARHPDRIVTDGSWRELQRVPSPTGCGTQCFALRGSGPADRFHCVIYADRPTACRELEAGSVNCLLARRRVGLAAPYSPPPSPSDAV